MTENFDAKAEASKIQQMAFSCLDDNSSVLTIRAANTEEALAKEMASIWGDPLKLEAVASELQQTAPTVGRYKVKIDFGDKPTDIIGFAFTNDNYLHSDFVMIAKKVDENVDVTVGRAKRTHHTEDYFKLESTTYSVNYPISHEK